ncbi:MAG: hypothetical protein ACREWG_06195 [Gammaproteobacteria bacterium]
MRADPITLGRTSGALDAYRCCERVLRATLGLGWLERVHGIKKIFQLLQDQLRPIAELDRNARER